MLVKELKEHEIEAPDVITSGELFFVVRMKTCIGDGASEICIPSWFHWSSSDRVEMLFGQAEVNKVYSVLVFLCVPSHNEVGLESFCLRIWSDTYRFYVSMNQTSMMNTLDRIYDLEENIYRNKVVEVFALLLFELG